jgi:hypothetical protein
LKRELKVREIAKRETLGVSIARRLSALRSRKGLAGCTGVRAGQHQFGLG